MTTDAHDAAGIAPDEVRRLRLEPGDRLIVRIADTRLTPEQLGRHQEHLQAVFPDNAVLIIVGDEIAVETAASDPQLATANFSGNTLMPDGDLDKLAEKLGAEIRRHLKPPRGDDPDDGLAGVPVRR